MEKKINEKFIRISGKFPIDRLINLDEDVVLAMKACCPKIDQNSNNDETYDITYVLKPLEVRFED